MLGKASDIKISDPQKGAKSVRGWLLEHPESTIISIQSTADEGADYFHIIYKEEPTWQINY